MNRLLVVVVLLNAYTNAEVSQQQKATGCPLGSFLSYDKTKCIECSAGYYSNIPNRNCTTSSTNSPSSCCTSCPHGHVCPAAGTSKPIQCPAGAAANYLRTACLTCGLGFYSAAGAECTTSTNYVGDCCKSCPHGHICVEPSGTVTPKICPAGTSANYARTACISCGVGYFSGYPGAQCSSSTNYASDCCNKCPPGHVCSNSSGTVVPQMCPAGTSANFARTACLECAPGYYSVASSQCSASTNYASDCCSKCPQGHQCPDWGTVTPKMCPAGTAANFARVTCLACPVGYFRGSPGSQCSASSNYADECCNKCPHGHVCTNSSGTVVPQLCSPGTSANYARTACLECAPGYYSLSAAQCVASTNYASDCCKSCPQGHQCPDWGTVTPKMCPAGTAANYARSSCLSCASGYFSFVGAQCITSSNYIGDCCKSCLNGSICL